MKTQSFTFTYHHYDIFFTYFPSSRGHCDRYGCPEEPDTPAEVNIERIYDNLNEQDVDPCDLSNIEEIEGACYDYAAEQNCPVDDEP